VTDEVPIGAHGAVDLSSLGARPASGGPTASGAAVDEVTEESFGAVVERSRRLPIIIAFWAEVSPASRELTTLLAEVAERYAGRLALVKCEVQRSPAIAEALQVYSVPAVVGIIAGRPAPLFQGVASAEQIAAVYEQVLQIAASAGLPAEEASAGDTPAETAPEPMPPRHREALEAMERGDAEAAVAAYSRALRENPKDGDARVGLARARHFQRTADADLAALIAVADAAPGDIEAAFGAADAEVAMGRAPAAFARLVEAVRGADGARRESVRERLVELFEVVGIHDAAVAEARRSLASALY
jgi:putative thioredoxin